MDLYQDKLLKIKQIESEFAWLIKNDRKNWLQVAKLLHRVEKGELYLIKAESFTQYVAKLAKVNHINISTLWRARSATSVFMEISGKTDIESLSAKEVLTTPEQLELYGKVRTIAPEKIVGELKEKILKGKSVRHELKSLWVTYRPLKHGKTERGRKTKLYQEYAVSSEEASQFHVPFSLFDDDINEAIAQSEYPEKILDNKKSKKYFTTPTELMTANIANALRAQEWMAYTLKQTFVARHQIFRNIIPGKLGGLPIQKQGNKLDVVGFARPRAENEEASPLPPAIFGATIRTNVASLVSDELLLKNSAFCHYYYLAIPMDEEIILDATQKINRSIGIIAIDNEVADTKHKIRMIRPARKNEINPENEKDLLMEMLLMGLNW